MKPVFTKLPAASRGNTFGSCKYAEVKGAKTLFSAPILSIVTLEIERFVPIVKNLVALCSKFKRPDKRRRSFPIVKPDSVAYVPQIKNVVLWFPPLAERLTLLVRPCRTTLVGQSK